MNENMNNKIQILFAAIQLTNKCNENCLFCFRRNVSEEPFSKIEKIIENLKKFNTDTIVLSGGEPLLRTDIKKILMLCRKLEIKTVLQSNGILLQKRISNLAPYIDRLSISLDGNTAENNALMRSKIQFEAVIKLLPEIKKRNIKVKLGTVVTKKNYKNIEDIGNLINGYVTTWKLYQFYPRINTFARRNKDQFIISDKLFNSVSKRVKEKLPKMKISTHTVKEFNKSPCLLIDPDGKVYITKKNKDYFMGNIIDDPANFINNYKKSNIADEIKKNFNKTYKD